MRKENYGDNFQADLLEQYKLYVEMADRVSSKRVKSNAFYISFLSAFLAFMSLVGSNKISLEYQSILMKLSSVLGILLCVLWNLTNRSYKQLNSKKFKVIHEMEQYLPFACYDREWELLEKGQNRKIYFKFTRRARKTSQDLFILIASKT